MAESKDAEPEVLDGQECPMCREKTLILTEHTTEVPYFGRMFIFSMSCSNQSCGYHKADVESAEQKEPCQYTFELQSEEDLKVRVVKSSEATVKIPHVGSIESGPASNGYVTNIEGVINRLKVMIEKIRDEAEDDSERKKAKNLVKKLQNALWGREKLKIILSDPSGNSAIISERAEKKSI
jgi:zinc finger protein